MQNAAQTSINWCCNEANLENWILFALFLEIFMEMINKPIKISFKRIENQSITL